MQSACAFADAMVPWACAYGMVCLSAAVACLLRELGIALGGQRWNGAWRRLPLAQFSGRLIAHREPTAR